jgi:spectinomycin phosphotransferase
VPVETPGLRTLPVVSRDPRPLLTATRDLDERLATVGVDDPHVAALLGLWQTGRERVLAVADLARTTAADTRAWADAPRVVAHTDPHPGNVLLGGAGDGDDTAAGADRSTAAPVSDGDAAAGGGDGVWLVDWDDAALATPEWDLMFVVGGVLATPTAADQAAFVEGYGPIELDPVRLRFAQSTRALHDLLDFAADVLATDRLPEADRRWSVEVLAGQLSPDGLVAFALGERGSDRLGP